MANWHVGSATFDFKVVAQSDTATESADATVTVTVTSVNRRAGRRRRLAVSTAEDTVLAFTAAQFDGVYQRRGLR